MAPGADGGALMTTAAHRIAEAPCGLLTLGQPVPLQSVEAEAWIAGRCARVTLTQRYLNAEPAPIETIFTFPLDDTAAVCAFSAQIGDRIIEGRVEERRRAFDAYDDALAEGRAAALLEGHGPGAFSLSLGHLLPGQEAVITLTWTELLPHQGPGVRFVLPTAIAPQAAARGPGAPGPGPASPGALDTNASAHALHAAEPPYRLSLTVHVALDPPLRVIESPSHPLRLTVSPRAMIATASSTQVALDRDFVLYLESVEPHTPSARVALSPFDDSKIVMITFFPDPDRLPSSGDEVHLLVDTSRAMAGDPLIMARHALIAFAEALSEGDSLDILTPDSLWSTPRRVDDATREAAREAARALTLSDHPDPLIDGLRHLAAASSGRPRQIVIITGGALRDVAAAEALCRRLGLRDRIFVLGLGAAVGQRGGLLRKLASLGRGAAELVHPAERAAPAAWRTAARLGAPVLEHIHVDWEGLDVEQSPALCPPVFGGDSLTLFARVRGGLHGAATLQADGRSWSVPVNLASADRGGPIPLLWAREALRDMELRLQREGGSAQQRRSADRLDAMIALSRKTGLLCSATSYVATDTSPHPGRLRDAALTDAPLHALGGLRAAAHPDQGHGDPPILRHIPVAMAANLLAAPLPEPPRAEATPLPRLDLAFTQGAAEPPSTSSTYAHNAPETPREGHGAASGPLDRPLPAPLYGQRSAALSEPDISRAPSLDPGRDDLSLNPDPPIDTDEAASRGPLDTDSFDNLMRLAAIAAPPLGAPPASRIASGPPPLGAFAPLAAPQRALAPLAAPQRAAGSPKGATDPLAMPIGAAQSPDILDEEADGRRERQDADLPLRSSALPFADRSAPDTGDDLALEHEHLDEQPASLDTLDDDHASLLERAADPRRPDLSPPRIGAPPDNDAPPRSDAPAAPRRAATADLAGTGAFAFADTAPSPSVQPGRPTPQPQPPALAASSAPPASSTPPTPKAAPPPPSAGLGGRSSTTANPPLQPQQPARPSVVSPFAHTEALDAIPAPRSFAPSEALLASGKVGEPAAGPQGDADSTLEDFSAVASPDDLKAGALPTSAHKPAPSKEKKQDEAEARGQQRLRATKAARSGAFSPDPDDQGFSDPYGAAEPDAEPAEQLAHTGAIRTAASKEAEGAKSAPLRVKAAQSPERAPMDKTEQHPSAMSAPNAQKAARSNLGVAFKVIAALVALTIIAMILGALAWLAVSAR